MIKGGVGGGNTVTGKTQEEKVDIIKYISSLTNYGVKRGKFGNEIYYKEKYVGLSFKNEKLKKDGTSDLKNGKIQIKNYLYDYLKFKGIEYSCSKK
jgi:hypothetical protein